MSLESHFIALWVREHPKISACGEAYANRIRQYPGSPLPPPQMDFFERGFGCSLDPIRLHVDRDAAEALGAEAFAVGRHIVLRQAPADWNAPSARYLLGHEIAHSLQQRTVGDTAPIMAVGGDDDPLEGEAHRAAAELLAGRRAAPLSRETHAIVRRVISVDSSSLNPVPRKKADGSTMNEPPEPKPLPASDGSGMAMDFRSPEFVFQGSVVLRGDLRDNMEDYELGWVQVLREWNWAIYRGEKKEDGSLLLRHSGLVNGRPTRESWHACLDSGNNRAHAGSLDLLDNGAPGVRKRIQGKWIVTRPDDRRTLQVELKDNPEDAYRLEMQNGTKRNFLYQVHIKLDFRTILTLKDPQGKLQFLKHVGWVVEWHYEFTPPNASGAVTPKKLARTRLEVGHVRDGAPKHPDFAGVLTARTFKTCSILAGENHKTPHIDRRTKWEDFDVNITPREGG